MVRIGEASHPGQVHSAGGGGRGQGLEVHVVVEALMRILYALLVDAPSSDTMDILQRLWDAAAVSTVAPTVEDLLA
jgi:hypothetical protein